MELSSLGFLYKIDQTSQYHVEDLLTLVKLRLQLEQLRDMQLRRADNRIAYLA